MARQLRRAVKEPGSSAEVSSVLPPGIQHPRYSTVIRSTAAAAALIALCGCSMLVGSATSRLATDLSAGVLNQDDPETVRQGLPAYLLILDGLIEGNPESTPLLLTGARLYGAYATAFVDDELRAQRLASRGHGYGLRALCLRRADLCEVVAGPYDAFSAVLARTNRSDVPVLFGFAAAWASWVQVHSNDWAAIAEVPKIRALMERVVELEETYEGGGAHAYLGVLSTQLPASLGGKPEVGRAHFERALELSVGRDLMVKVLYARWYARLVFDRSLHDRLLSEVLEAEPEAPRLTLSNTLARGQARELLADADDYF